MHLIVVGASAGLGRSLANKLAQNGHDLTIAASSQEDLDALASDLRIRYSVKVATAVMRLSCDERSVRCVLDAAAELGPLDGVLFPLGFSRNDDDGTLAASEIERLVGTNMGAAMALTAAVLPGLLQKGKGHLVFFGSVAAERGRSSNVVYASAKRGLQSFAESVRHRCSASQVRVQYYQLGYLNTAQTFGKKLPFPAAEPDAAAEFIVARLDKDFGSCYFPWFWRFICLGLKLTPWFLFKKLKF